MTIVSLGLALIALFYLLAKTCDDYFVESLEIITRRLKLSDDVAGATFMAIGSSAPELFTAIIALLKVGAESIGAGTIVGSAIFNILVIVGASAIVSTAHLAWRPIMRDIGFYILSLVILLWTFSDGIIQLHEASLYLLVYGLYLLVLKYWKYWFPENKIRQTLLYLKEEAHEIKQQWETRHQKEPPLVAFFHTLFFFPFPNLRANQKFFLRTFFLSLAYIALLSWLLVETAVELAHLLHVPQAIIALTVLAIGTSIPDLLSSVLVSRRHRSDMAIANAVGSNTFDILVGLGLPWFFFILWKNEAVVVGNQNLFSSMVLLFGSVLALLLLLIIEKWKIRKIPGYILIGIYLGYLFYEISQATGGGI